MWIQGIAIGAEKRDQMTRAGADFPLAISQLGIRISAVSVILCTRWSYKQFSSGSQLILPDFRQKPIPGMCFGS